MVSPGSEQIYATIKRDGQLQILEEAGATVLTNACGPCIGQWQREDGTEGQTNTIVTSFNRNFRGRADANPDTQAFVGSPEVVMALGIAGRLDFDPRRDSLTAPDGSNWQFQPPAPAPDIPENGFVRTEEGYRAPAVNSKEVDIVIAPDSKRLQLLTPFKPLAISDYEHMSLLLKTKGKTTTDHISPAGKWLKLRGHLDNISNNMFIGATNAFTNAIGTTKDPESGQAVPVWLERSRGAFSPSGLLGCRSWRGARLPARSDPMDQGACCRLVRGESGRNREGQLFLNNTDKFLCIKRFGKSVPRAQTPRLGE